MDGKYFKNSRTICKTILRNGYDAYVISPQLQFELAGGELNEIDIACEIDFEELCRLFPEVALPAHRGVGEDDVFAVLEENGVVYNFCYTDVEETSEVEKTITTASRRMLRLMWDKNMMPHRLTGPDYHKTGAVEEDFLDFSKGKIILRGLPERTIKSNYILAVRAFRLAVNNEMQIDRASWMAIVRTASRVLDYVPVTDVMKEWREVKPRFMWRFVKYMYDSYMLHGLLPEIVGLSCVNQTNGVGGPRHTVFEHTIECMKAYPEGEFENDWLGTFAMLFHDVGKLYTADFFDAEEFFFQHHRASAKISRQLLQRLRCPADEIDVVCHLCRHHMRFRAMLSDRGIRRFAVLEERERLIQMTKANIKAHGEQNTNLNHNLKYLERADKPEFMIEPLLNGKEIMEFTGLEPGPQVGIIRDALLKAQVDGLVTSVPQAVEFIKNYNA